MRIGQVQNKASMSFARPPDLCVRQSEMLAEMQAISSSSGSRPIASPRQDCSGNLNDSAVFCNASIKLLADGFFSSISTASPFSSELIMVSIFSRYYRETC
jgi:hypothetical protein